MTPLDLASILAFGEWGWELRCPWPAFLDAYFLSFCQHCNIQYEMVGRTLGG